MTTDETEIFFSYAQNLEDVLLWRALGQVPSGFYIDVGAASPVVDSVTLAFYERGWRGINIEPHPASFAELATARPADINLEVAVADRPGEGLLALADHPALSTLQPTETARLRALGMSRATVPVTVTTLAAVWAEHVPDGQPVHFLKVDVEGLEREVLFGNDWKLNRPWIALVEATRPQGSLPTHEKWERILVEADYRFAYFDGVNRFYVAGEHADLLSSFDRPPNSLDRYMRATERDAILRVQELEKERSQLLSTRSWRWTRPLRAIADWARGIRGRGLPPNTP